MAEPSREREPLFIRTGWDSIAAVAVIAIRARVWAW
jgi:uncharacterized ion transporter superfamily protein YfcC